MFGIGAVDGLYSMAEYEILVFFSSEEATALLVWWSGGGAGGPVICICYTAHKLVGGVLLE